MQAADSMFRRREGWDWSECRQCGALVASEKAHKSWHRELAKRGVR